jgi:hypothetical protein
MIDLTSGAGSPEADDWTVRTSAFSSSMAFAMSATVIFL